MLTAARGLRAASRLPRGELALHVVAGAVVVVGLLANVLRPVAPDIGPVPSPGQWFEAAHLDRVRVYRAPLYTVAAAATLIRVVVPCLAAFTSAGRRAVRRVVDRVGGARPARAAAAVVVAVVVLTDLAVLPLAFWAGYVHEGRWGFRTSGPAGWTYDWFVAVAPVWVAAGVLTLVAYGLMRWWPRAWVPVAALGGALLTGAFVFAAPLVLEPLRFRTVPLPDGPVRAAVEDVVARSGERVERILVADASRRTTRHNAYVSGLGASRRVVLYDNLVRERPPAEVAMVLAHELGHQRNDDLARGTGLGAAGAVLLVYAVALVVRSRAAAGRQSGQDDPAAAVVVMVAVVMLNLCTLPLQNLVSRRAEAAADLAALELTRDPATFTTMNVQLALSNLSHPAPPAWVRVLWSTHPPTADRLAMAVWWAGRAGVEPPSTPDEGPAAG